MLSYNSQGEAMVVEKRRVKGIFLENLELKDFPFDVQVSRNTLQRNWFLSLLAFPVYWLHVAKLEKYFVNE